MKDIKISVNKFCEYNRSSSSKRRNDIVKAQKFPKTGDGYPQYYSLVRKHIIEFICKNEEIHLNEAISKLDSRTEPTQWYKTDNKISRQLIEDTKKLNLTIFSKYDLRACNERISVFLSNIEIKVNPDILIFKENEVVGGIKTHFSKTKPLGEETRLDIALMLKKSMEKDYTNLNPKLCFSVDIPSGSISSAKKSFKKRLERLEFTASEIANLWDNIKEDLT